MATASHTISVGDLISYCSSGKNYTGCEVLAVGSRQGEPTYAVLRGDHEVEIRACLVTVALSEHSRIICDSIDHTIDDVALREHSRIICDSIDQTLDYSDDEQAPEGYDERAAGEPWDC